MNKKSSIAAAGESAFHKSSAAHRTADAPKPRIGAEEIAEALRILQKYKTGKARLEKRIVSDELWWQMRHWQDMDAGNPDDLRPASGWLFNVVMSKHADAVQAYPEPVILPREAGDVKEAQRLSSVIPVVLEQNGFEETWSDNSFQKLKSGTAIYKVVWDAEKHNGLGDISIRRVLPLDIFWEPGVEDIQSSANVFHTQLVDRAEIEARYPIAVGHLSDSPFTATKFLYDDNVDTSGKVTVIDWYYKKRVGSRTVLHYCKFCGSAVLYATENEVNPPMRTVTAPDGTQYEIAVARPMSETGLYEHGRYPFVFDRLFPQEGTPCGYGYIDIGKSAQEQIDRLNQQITKNAIMAASPRWFVRTDGAVNEEEFADWTTPLVHVNGNLGADSLQQLVVRPLDNVYVAVLNNWVQSLKETTGNRDVMNGGAPAGVTAASAIAAMQEQSGKTSKASTLSAYRAFTRVVELVIELIRQFYTLPRQFRITGEDGAAKFVSYSNAALRGEAEGSVPSAAGPGDANLSGAMRLPPVFDIRVSAQRRSAYTRMSQNELALQLYQLGFFDPARSAQALKALEMMDFDGREEVAAKIRNEDWGRFRAAAASIMGLEGAVGAGRGAAPKSAVKTGAGMPALYDNVTGETGRERKAMTRARERSQNSTQPD